jgi:PilZ domain
MHPISAVNAEERRPQENWIQRLLAGRPRRAERHRLPPLIAFHWDGPTPRAHRIADISENGMYLVTSTRWAPRTLLMMSLQRNGATGNTPDDSIMVQAMVIRSGRNGVGLAFVPAEIYAVRRGPEPSAIGADRAALRSFLDRALSNRA